jgi:hypothetical protein
VPLSAALPTIRDRHGEVAAAATRQQVSYKGFLVELLSLECDDREQRSKARLVHEAGAAGRRSGKTDDRYFSAEFATPLLLTDTALGKYRHMAVLP